MNLALLGGTPVSEGFLPPYNSIGDEEKQAVIKVMNERILSDFIARAGGHFLGGKYVKALEKQFCEYFKVQYAVSFNSASTALDAAVGALTLEEGSEIITSPYTMSATATVVLLNNLVPVFADIEENSFCLEPQSIRQNITENTKAILAVNLFGGSADYDAILKIVQRNNLMVIEDNAQAPGATYKGRFAGTIGDIGVFSFNVHKVIQSGEGGVLLTNNKDYAFRAQLIRNHGEAVIDDLLGQGIYEPIIGSNYRLTEIQAAVAAEQFKKLDKLNDYRIKLADYLSEQLRQFDWLIEPQVFPDSRHVYYIYPIRFLADKIKISRKTFAKAMQAEGFSIVEGYQKPLYLLPYYQRELNQRGRYNKGICPTAERMHEKELFFTTICQPPQTAREIDLFIKAIQKIQDNIRELQEYEKQI